MEYSNPKLLSEDEVKMIFIECFFRTVDIMKRLDDIGINDSDKTKTIYREYQDTWKDILLGYKRDLVILAKQVRDGKYDCSNFYDPKHIDGDGFLKKLLSQIESYEYFADRVEEKAHEWRLKANVPANPQLFLNHKTTFLSFLLDPSLSKFDLEKLCVIINRIVDKNRKITYLEKSLTNNHVILTQAEREKYSKYLSNFQNENQTETKTITKYMAKTGNKMEDWLFGKDF